MKIKRFVAKDMRTALTEVKEFLGPDAIILSNKKVAEGVEIVAAIDPESQNAASQKPAHAPAQAAATSGHQPRQEPRFSVRVDDNDSMPANRKIESEQAEAPADSLRELLARQMIKQQGREPAAQNSKRQPAAVQPAVNPAAAFERQSSGTTQGIAASQWQELTKQQQQQAQSMATQFDAMRNEMLSMRQLLQHQVSGLMWQDLARREPVRALVIEHLQQLGLSEQVADQLACFMPEDIGASEAWDTAMELLSGQLSTTNDDILRRGGIIALVGPTGVGKTTTVAKLAAGFAKRHGADQVALITTDSYRIGAFEQLATYGRIIGCPVKQAKDSDELAVLLNQMAQRKLILIDTAGMSQRDVRLAEKLASLVHNSRVKIKSYLVLSATAQARVMQETVLQFKRISLAGCIFTKLDECLSLGEVINVAIQNALPVSYLTNGQRVPEDLVVADAADLVQRAEILRLTHSSNGHQWYQDEVSRAETAYA
ncbi:MULTISPECIES: flagellar biosynthesis protein FlhF [unclassified Arsukibacterium]|uniref:flagellar biosynthesis protein FlhF n=1 Tax=unclassified Arsukibacterium TaxID=2635278 RepID=UPI000C927634|nr:MULTISPECIES: flagellar biosynthesis protein FlhF [unclassified Arsukibacterium]MAA95386.1 flagellar biosynthesis protein FlhF [Rheinheimera sp.]HAW93110.1 flagellar biosynthesis protein FlhF [Candidatus Azambacteria bacterium]|tara:strand:+ start:17114 stop:18568 length:1455 start_codon:yes stop_codon:yes gene_type:complete